MFPAWSCAAAMALQNGLARARAAVPQLLAERVADGACFLQAEEPGK